MPYLPIALTAYVLNSISVLIDKFLISKEFKHPIVYVFFISTASLLGLLALPFTQIPSLWAFALTSSSTVLWTCGIYALFSALKIGPASRVIPVIGVLTPLFLLAESAISGTIAINETWAVIILVLGLLSLTLPDWRGHFKPSELFLEILASAFFAVNYLLLKQAYNQADFLTVLVWSRLILVPILLFFILLPRFRAIILTKDQNRTNFRFFSTAGALLFAGQISGAAAQLLLNFSISLASPAVVNSIQGVQYVVLFSASVILAKRFPSIFGENLSKRSIIAKIFGVLLVFLGLFILSSSQTDQKPDFKIGITYSPRYAAELGLDPKKTFNEIVDELQIKYLRLPVYWSDVEKKRGVFDFSGIDYYLKIAEEKNIRVVLTLGFKQPRWPECYFPSWTEELDKDERKRAVEESVKKQIEYFRKYKSVYLWQIENEPFFHFGKCELGDFQSNEFLKSEIDIIKAADKRPVMVTDSGEVSLWSKASKDADVFGTTVYRQVWNPYIGKFNHFLPPFAYDLRARVVKYFVNKDISRFMVSELQAEPWQTEPLALNQINLNNQVENFPPEQILKNIDYAKEIGFEEIYLWGVEWWYFMRSKGAPQYIEIVKEEFR